MIYLKLYFIYAARGLAKTRKSRAVCNEAFPNFGLLHIDSGDSVNLLYRYMIYKPSNSSLIGFNQ